MSVTRALLSVAISRHTCLHTPVKGHISVMCVTSNLLDIPTLRDTCLHIHEYDVCHKQYAGPGSIKTYVLLHVVCVKGD